MKEYIKHVVLDIYFWKMWPIKGTLKFKIQWIHLKYCFEDLRQILFLKRSLQDTIFVKKAVLNVKFNYATQRGVK